MKSQCNRDTLNNKPAHKGFMDQIAKTLKCQSMNRPPCRNRMLWKKVSSTIQKCSASNSVLSRKTENCHHMML